MRLLAFAALLVCTQFIVTPYGQDTILNNNNRNKTIIDSSNINPYSETLVQRKIAAILTASGSAEVVLGIVFTTNHTLENIFKSAGNASMGRTYDYAFWIAGTIQVCIGLPMLIVSEISKSKHDKWEKSHGKHKVSFNGSSIIMEF
jgi:hypothetical protein